MFRTTLNFDMRSAEFGAPQNELYRAALDMCAYADKHGVERINIPEHHTLDNAIPATSLLAAAIGARTEQIAISLGAIILPLHDPVDVAEQIAVADHICGGRLHAVLVAGYGHSEFRLFGKSMKDRGKLMDEGLEVITRALAGEQFQYGDREVFVRPLPHSQPPRLYVGGGVPAAAKRAAKFNAGFWPMKNELIPLYQEECRKLGREPGAILPGSVGVYVAEDVDKAWEEIGPYIAHQMVAYASLSAEASESNSPMHGLSTPEQVRKSGVFQILTPDQCVELAKSRAISIAPLIGGNPPDVGWKCLELFVSEALPKIKALGEFKGEYTYA